MKMINCLDEFKRECEIEAIETYINQECIDAIGRSVVKYGPKDGLIMAPTEIPFNVLLLNARLNDVYTESFKAYREYVKKYLVQLRKRSPNKGSFFFSYAHALSSFASQTPPIMRKRY